MSTSPTYQQQARQGPGLEAILAGIRMTETGSYRGDYQMVGPRFNGHTYYGAYQMDTQTWPQWAALAGYGGADIRSPEAQDAVAAYIMNQYYLRYGSWDLASMAWFAGPAEASKVARRGYTNLTSILNPKIREYVQKVNDASRQAMSDPTGAFTAHIPAYQLAQTSAGGSWIMPVAGKSEYSNSFYVPRNNRTGIHGAIDIYATKGTPIVSPVSGKVLSTKKSDIGGYTVRILGDDGVTYYFAHMASQAVVSQGQHVNAGYHIGYVGNTGNARGTTPHLHFSMHLGSKLINPYSYLEASTHYGVTQTPDPAAVTSTTLGPQRSGVTGVLTNWLQGMSDAVRANATVEPSDETDTETPDKPNIPEMM